MPGTLKDPKVIKQLTDRLRRIEGQARGIQRMLEEGRPCGEIITQLTALRNAVNKVAAQVIVENLEACILNGEPGDGPEGGPAGGQAPVPAALAKN